jgi:hypothetical protein
MSGLDEKSTTDIIVPNRHAAGYSSTTKILTISNFKEFAGAG